MDQQIYKALRAQNIRSEISCLIEQLNCFERKNWWCRDFDSIVVVASSQVRANVLLLYKIHIKKVCSSPPRFKSKGRGTQMPSNIRMYVGEDETEDVKAKRELSKSSTTKRRGFAENQTRRERCCKWKFVLSEQTKKWYLIASVLLDLVFFDCCVAVFYTTAITRSC